MLIDNGFEHVETYIQSGNVILSSDTDPATRIRNLIKESFDLDIHVMTISLTNFRKSHTKNPYVGFEGKFVHFYFFGNETVPNISIIDNLSAVTESYQIEDNVLYLHAPSGIGRSKLVANIDRCLGTIATGRNLNTVNKLLKIADDLIVD